jgi:hypothetical protein
MKPQIPKTAVQPIPLLLSALTIFKFTRAPFYSCTLRARRILLFLPCTEFGCCAARPAPVERLFCRP